MTHWPLGRSHYPPPHTHTHFHTHAHTDPARRAASLETIAKGKLTLQGPMMLRQGYLGLIPRLPIFIDNVTDPNETFGAKSEAWNCSEW